MRIYTKSGDKGETGLLGGVRVPKDDLRIAAIGEVDELNAIIGVLRSMLRRAQHDILKQIQSNLFAIGAELAEPDAKQKRRTRLSEQNRKSPFDENRSRVLEKEIDRMENALPPLKNFILPAGTTFSAHAHLARAVCRRAERAVVALHRKSPLNQNILIYLNRLSDFLFMLAREDMFRQKKKEEIWHSVKIP